MPWLKPAPLTLTSTVDGVWPVGDVIVSQGVPDGVSSSVLNVVGKPLCIVNGCAGGFGPPTNCANSSSVVLTTRSFAALTIKTTATVRVPLGTPDATTLTAPKCTPSDRPDGFTPISTAPGVV